MVRGRGSGFEHTREQADPTFTPAWPDGRRTGFAFCGFAVLHFWRGARGEKK